MAPNNKKKNHKKTPPAIDGNNNQVVVVDTTDNAADAAAAPSSSPTPSSSSTSRKASRVEPPPKPYRVAESKIFGRYLVAARDLKAGETVLTQLPVVIGPCGEPVCLGCYVPTPSRSKQYKCPGCGWPLCGFKCTGLKRPTGHSVWECSALREKRVADHLDRSKGKELIHSYEAITALRCMLLKQNDPVAWAQLAKMESHNDVRIKCETLWKRNQEVVVDRLRDLWGFKEFAADEIHTMIGVLEVNCFEIGQNGARARALYAEAFLLAHDCSANTSHSDDTESYAITVRVIRDVNADAAITLSYAYTLQGTLKRREHLQEGKFFWCQCDRCADPTELGSYSSAIQCPKCRGGLIMSTDPLNQEADWKCRSCRYIVTAESMLKLIDTVYKELDAIDANSVVAFEQFLTKYRNVFHKNHYLCVCAKHSLFQLYGRSDGYLIHELSVNQLRLKEQYCRDILAVVDLLDPGLSKLRGVIMYELHAPIMIQATRLFEAHEIKANDLKRRLREVIKLLRDSERILSLEPIGSSEHEMSLAAQDALNRIGKV